MGLPPLGIALLTLFILFGLMIIAAILLLAIQSSIVFDGTILVGYLLLCASGALIAYITVARSRERMFGKSLSMLPAYAVLGLVAANWKGLVMVGVFNMAGWLSTW